MPRTTKQADGKARWQAAIKYRPLTTLSPHENNPKTHGTEQIRALSRSMAAHNFVNPILIDTQGVIIAGHARFEAAKLLGLEQVPTITLDHLTEAQQRAYRIADNRLGEIDSAWSMDLLRLEVVT